MSYRHCVVVQCVHVCVSVFLSVYECDLKIIAESSMIIGRFCVFPDTTTGDFSAIIIHSYPIITATNTTHNHCHIFPFQRNFDGCQNTEHKRQLPWIDDLPRTAVYAYGSSVDTSQRNGNRSSQRASLPPVRVLSVFYRIKVRASRTWIADVKPCNCRAHEVEMRRWFV